MDSSSFFAGHGNKEVFPLGRTFQSVAKDSLDRAARVDPVTGTLSKTFENFSMARTPQALASVKSHLPRFCRARAPCTNLGISSLHFSERRRDRMTRTALTSLETMSHHKPSDLSVEKFMTVP